MTSMAEPAVHWNHSTRAVLVDALSRLPASRCVVELGPDEVTVALNPARHGRGEHRALGACGAALSTAKVVLRVLGARSRMFFPHNPDRPDVVAVLRVREPAPATEHDWVRYLALRRLTESGPETPAPVGAEVLAALARENDWPRTRVVPLPPEEPAAALGFGSRLPVLTNRDTADEQVLAGAVTHTLRLAAAAHGLKTAVLSRSAIIGGHASVAQAVVLVAGPAEGPR
ncbi:hypothetical protein [Amycolatopsis sp. FDAARGOS 1241]|uniref:hypothetical protein n=1 Tax=Amycolatopsis sp. FDAARGOS 1241 TaxID=2778070 RepID=UPI00194E90E5|nr:hypothetical protein [Amycolatopsis sp. FDAARGOS 1241]QRP42905.1 hypothetical protein I6J71_25940 [Amycolatopsis sp. FDAARGOS 1241]